MAENSSKNPEAARKESEAALAEAEARIAKAKKDIAEHEKDEAAAKDRDLQSANRDKAIAEAKKAAAEADKASFAVLLPTTTTKPLEGKVELDDKAGYFADLLAYQCLKVAAGEIVKLLSTKFDKGKKIYLVTKLEWQQAAAQLAEVSFRLQTFGQYFDDLKKYNVKSDCVTVSENGVARLAATLSAALAVAPAVLGGIADIAALFREDRTIKGRIVSLNQTALLAEVARELQLQHDAQVYLPSLSMTLKSGIVNEFKNVREKDTVAREKRSEIDRLINNLSHEIDRLDAKLKTAQEKLTSISMKQAEKQRLQGEIQNVKEQLVTPRQNKSTAEIAKGHFDAAISAFAEFALKLSSIPDGATGSPLAALSEVSLLSECSKLLYVSVVSQGGEFEARRTIWTSGKVYHRGGVVCTYILFQPDGQIISSGTVASDLHAEEGKLNPNDAKLGIRGAALSG